VSASVDVSPAPASASSDVVRIMPPIKRVKPIGDDDARKEVQVVLRASLSTNDAGSRALDRLEAKGATLLRLKDCKPNGVWRHYVLYQHGPDLRYVCLLCDQYSGHFGATSHLWKHLSSHHPVEHGMLMESGEQSSTQSSLPSAAACFIPRKTRSTQAQFVSKGTRERLTSAA